MKALAPILLLALLGSSEAHLQWQLHLGRNLLQVTPLATQPAAATVPAATQPAAAAVQPAAAAVEQPAAATAIPAAATAEPAIPTTQPAAAAVQPAAAVPTQPAATAATLPATYQNGAGAADMTEPAAAVDAPAASPTLVAFQGRQGIYAVADPPPPPRPVAAPGLPGAAAAAGGLAAATRAPVGPPPIAAGENLMVVMTVMGQNAQQIYRNQQAVKQQVAAAAGVSPAQVLFYNQTANQDPRTGVTALSLSLNIECGSEAACAEAGQTLQNSTTTTRVSDSLARSGISVLPGTFQVYGVNSFGRYRGNETLYENQQLLAARPATTINYDDTLARFGQPTATATPSAVPGAMPGMPLGNFSIPGFEPTPTTGAAGVQPAFNLSDFQVPTQSLLPAGAVPLTTNVTTVEERPRSSASSTVLGVSTLLSALIAVIALL